MKTNQVIECLKARRSCRAFSDRMPERELIEAVCEAGTYAPTGHGRQSPLIVAITNKGVRDRLSKMNARIWNELTLKRGGTPKPNVDPFYGAPVVLLVLADADVVTAEYATKTVFRVENAPLNPKVGIDSFDILPME